MGYQLINIDDNEDLTELHSDDYVLALEEALEHLGYFVDESDDDDDDDEYEDDYPD